MAGSTLDFAGAGLGAACATGAGLAVGSGTGGGGATGSGVGSGAGGGGGATTFLGLGSTLGGGGGATVLALGAGATVASELTYVSYNCRI